MALKAKIVWDDEGTVVAEAELGEVKPIKPKPPPAPVVPEPTWLGILESWIATYNYEHLVKQLATKWGVAREHVVQAVLQTSVKMFPPKENTPSAFLATLSNLVHVFISLLNAPPSPPQPVPDFDALYQQIVDMGLKSQFDALMLKFGATERNFILSMISMRMQTTGGDLKTTIEQLLA